MKKSESTPFLLIEDGTVQTYGRIVGRPIAPGFFLVQFEGPGPRYGRILPTEELTRFTVFANDAEREAFMKPVDKSEAPAQESAKVPDGNSTTGDNAT